MQRPPAPQGTPLALRAMVAVGNLMHQISVEGHEPVRYRSAAEIAAEDVRHRIWSGQMQPGAKVSIDDLARELGLSATPVREALKALEGEGLVSIVARSGVRVRRISVEEVAEVYAIKEVLEPLMIRWAMVRGTPAQIAELIDLARILADHAREQRLDEYVGVVERRFRLLLEMAGSDVLAAIYRTMDGRVRLMRYRNLAQPGRLQGGAVEHRKLARAVAEGDVDRASALTAGFVRAAARSLLTLIERDGGYGQASPRPSSSRPLLEALMSTSANGSLPTASKKRR